MVRSATCRCSRWCWSRSLCHWSQAGRCRCSYWHSRCSWPHSCRDYSHTHLCPVHICCHETQVDRCRCTCWRHHGTDRRYCRDLGRNTISHLYALNPIWLNLHYTLQTSHPYWVCSHLCQSHTSDQCNLAGTGTGNPPLCYDKWHHCGTGFSHTHWCQSHTFDLKGQKGQIKWKITFQTLTNVERVLLSRTGGYLAILQGRGRKSSGSLQPLYTLLHFYMVWGCKVQVRSHSFHLVTERTYAFKFPMFPNSWNRYYFQERINPGLYPTSLSISISTQANRKPLPVSCYCVITDRKQELGTWFWAGISPPLILATVTCFSTACYPCKADSFYTQKQESLLVATGWWFLKTTCGWTR